MTANRKIERINQAALRFINERVHVIHLIACYRKETRQSAPGMVDGSTATSVIAPQPTKPTDPEPAKRSPARGPPLWDACDAQVQEGVDVEPDWGISAHGAPDDRVGSISASGGEQGGE